MSQVTLPHALTNGTTAYGSEVRGNDDAIVTVLNSQIDKTNIAAGAGIEASKLSTTPGERIVSANLEDDAVTFDKLRDDASTDANRAVGRDHIRNSSIVRRSISLGVADYAGSAALAPGGGSGTVIAPNGNSYIVTALSGTTTLPVGVFLVVGAAPASTNIPTKLDLYLNTATNLWTILIGNLHLTSNLTVTSFTFRVHYIAAS